ncbi:unnamed protein product [Phaedon cochleariae]|uniref:non-specific serine/threonine protein kinase n=1 Tax=Phaedon cochleariae TaxID=80249 RepID=A0A9N9SAX3_PHACE|nr:unnamed protein product [Phaedon cochleariae]
MAKTAPKRKAANGYKLAEPLPKGEILQDISKKQWKLGPSIGQGGFGEIYSAQEVGAGGSKYPYVVKIEPHANGPLFVEMHFYMRIAKYEDVESFKKERGLKTFGMPHYLGSGSHEYKEEKYRFIVMEKFGTDLWKIFLENNKIFPATTVFKVAVQILDVLEYIHKRGYIHGDIKGANILMGTTKETQNKQVYLVDYGLACKYNGDTVFKPDPKKAHNGTIEYLSRDAHQGVQSRRGDLEILAYNIIQWLGCTLPWEKHLKDPKVVQQSKEEYMTSVPKFMKACFEKKSPPGPVVDFLNYHSTLKHDSVPDYKNIRKIFLSGLEKGDALGKPLHFSPSKKTPMKRKMEGSSPLPKQKKGRKKIEEPSEDERETSDDEEMQVTPQTRKKVGKQTSPKRKREKKKLLDELSEDEKENIVDDEPIEETHLSNDEIADSPPKRGRGKVVKQSTQKRKAIIQKDAEEPPEDRHEEGSPIQDDVPDRESEEFPRTPTRRGRARINYKEDSEDEKKSRKRPTKKTASTKEVHVTGDSTHRYNDAMKEVVRKKMQNGNLKSKKEPPVEHDDDDMVGYTDSMKEIAMKKKKKVVGKRGRKANLAPVASTSSYTGPAIAKNGIVKVISRQDVIKNVQSDSE